MTIMFLCPRRRPFRESLVDLSGTNLQSSRKPGIHNINMGGTAASVDSQGNWYRSELGVGSSIGGSCTCPDGASFQVGTYDDGKALACEGGLAGPISNLPANAANKKVTCAPKESSGGPAACAVEGGLCYCNGKVNFTDGQGNTASMDVEGHVQCDTANFGDPKIGAPKYCTCEIGLPRKCANDGAACACKGTVMYGANSHWTSKESAGSLQCSAETFGTDPSGLGAKNACYCKQSFTKCADEGEECTCNGAVQFGVEGHWTKPHDVNGTVQCTADALGGDPKPWFRKACYCLR